MADVSGQDAEQRLGLVNDAARTVSARFVTFLTVGVYIAVTIAATTDEMLVRGSLVNLPLLNVQIPISGVFGFYMVAPWLIMVLHCDLLVQLSVLSRKLVRFQGALSDLNPAQRDWLRDRMANYHYVQFLGGVPSGPLRGVLPGVVLFGSMIVLPILLLCWTQLRFLPLRDSVVTWSHRLALIADVAVILIFLYPAITRRDVHVWSERPEHGRLRRLSSLRTVVVLACAAVLVFSVRAGTQPEGGGPSTWYRPNPNLDLHDKVLTRMDLSPETINALRDNDVRQREAELAKVLQLNVLQGHDLRGANLKNAVLPKLDLRTLIDEKGETISSTLLAGANLTWTQMQQVLLDDADVRGAKLQGAQLQGASMVRVMMQHADLDGAQLQEANLSNSHLEGAALPQAQLQGATLENAILVGAVLKAAQLQGANLRAAQLQDADLSDASLDGADLSGANLERANLRGAQLRGSILCGAAIDGADFYGANLDLADICGAVEHQLDGNVDLIQPVCFGQCGAQAEYYPCRPSREEEIYRTSLNKHLKTLACGDPYTARGLSKRALRGEAVRENLAQVLVQGSSEPDCLGVQLLSGKVLESLRERGRAVGTDAS